MLVRKDYFDQDFFHSLNTRRTSKRLLQHVEGSLWRAVLKTQKPFLITVQTWAWTYDDTH